MLTEQELIERIPQTKGNEKRELLLRLCDFRSETADAFWTERLKPQYLPYLCYSRSDAASDYAAEQLESAVNHVLASENQSAELTEELWYALNLSVFKESEQILKVLDKIGQHDAKFRTITLDRKILLYSETLPPFLRQMANLAYAHGYDTHFIPLLNDLLICTLLRADGAFDASVRKLAEQYPDAFGYAGFFTEFVRDTSCAYELYARPERLEQILFTLNHLELQENSYEQYAPVWFYGVKHRIWNQKICLKQLDLRWISFLAHAAGYATKSQKQNISKILFAFTELKEYRMILQEYFFQAALEDTSETNLIGFMRCGGYHRTDELIQGISRNICTGKNNYYALFAVFELLDLKKPEKLRLLAEAREYIESADHQESWCALRSHFLHEVKLYQNDEQSETH